MWPLSTVCFVCNIQLTKVIIIFPSYKWLALTRAGWCVVCVIDYPGSSISYFAFHKVVRHCYSGEEGEFVIFLREISSGFCTPKTCYDRFILRRVIQTIKRGRRRFLGTRCTLQKRTTLNRKQQPTFSSAISLSRVAISIDSATSAISSLYLSNDSATSLASCRPTTTTWQLLQTTYIRLWRFPQYILMVPPAPVADSKAQGEGRWWRRPYCPIAIFFS